jgi:hypothetical protein
MQVEAGPMGEVAEKIVEGSLRVGTRTHLAVNLQGVAVEDMPLPTVAGKAGPVQELEEEQEMAVTAAAVDMAPDMAEVAANRPAMRALVVTVMEVAVTEVPRRRHLLSQRDCLGR